MNSVKNSPSSLKEGTPQQDLSPLFGGMFSDELDLMGHRSQVSNNWVLNNPSLKLYGRARTVLLETVETDDENIAEGLGFLGSMEPGEILVVAGSPEYAYFGELMSRLSMRQGLGGAVIDGLTRDSAFTRTQDLPVFARGYSPVDIKGRGRVCATDLPVDIDGIRVSPGDWVFGDSDAVVFVPIGLAAEVDRRVWSAVAQEKKIINLIDSGESIEAILDFTDGF